MTKDTGKPTFKSDPHDPNEIDIPSPFDGTVARVTLASLDARIKDLEGVVSDMMLGIFSLAERYKTGKPEESEESEKVNHFFIAMETASGLYLDVYLGTDITGDWPSPIYDNSFILKLYGNDNAVETHGAHQGNWICVSKGNQRPHTIAPGASARAKQLIKEAQG